MSRAEITRVVTAGSFSLDGGVWDVKNNVWVVGDDYECVVIDAAHWAEPIVAAVGGRTVRAVLLTHAHDDHINAAPELCAATDAPSYLHPADRVLWDQVHESTPDGELADGNEFEVAGITLRTLHTPGHSPGACSFYSPELGVVFTGDTLFQGGPGATGRSYSDFPTIIDSIRDKLLPLPEETAVHTGHGDDTSIGAELPDLEAWIARGH
ncbi:MBL fold metallo-hydrolase [Kribbella sp. NBC_01245]|uniref:MBL fold metallo-hydrolase n=1 Tax=Kribbella sp. NBC_01245 TaxID=2903578 RepID=UPI002E288FC1|nr:MBL fold metallo-hydrolase [Kribbella sp. NBC_01245]